MNLQENTIEWISGPKNEMAAVSQTYLGGGQPPWVPGRPVLWLLEKIYIES